MTAAQRATLERMYRSAAIRSDGYSRDTAAALRAALGTCGTCAHADTEIPKDGWCYCAAPAKHEMDPAFPFAYQAMPLGQRCTGYTPKEGA